MTLMKYDGKQFLLDIGLRALLFSLYALFEVIPPFKRVIHPEEVWLYKNPVTESYCPMNVLWELVIFLPLSAIFINYVLHRDKMDVIQAFLSFSLILSLNGALTNIFKVIVGRPRPDFYYRCFPDGNGNDDLKDCTGNIQMINEGLKSFPSGHSSIAFACLGFLSLYMAGKMHLFSSKGKGTTWKLLSFLFPLIAATVVAISRMCDYHHHWQDVLCGSLLGFSVCWLCYHNYYPSLTADYSNIPLTALTTKIMPDHLQVKDV
ncbi:UNVERIFIED_CONTAM: hypothetical protein PYX00_007431 [Menopon gallinae]|uniref:Phosphatidic acid phosphatase type 2/haloperoxidase domain-containing protein n=1 Tax=Menopon gallinae TaxID=328185 RepID=A0AAW2HJ06_9NEOP